MRAPAAAVLALALGALGCRDREQQAALDGAAARAEVAAACASAEAKADGGEVGDARVTCLTERCREKCAGGYAGTKTLGRTCVDACAAVGGCATDADCSPGDHCVAIAPIVRRCLPPR